MMFLATYYNPNADCDKDENGRIAEVFTDFTEYYKRTFSPITEPKILVAFTLKNCKNYQERKSETREIAILTSNILSECYGLSWYEMGLISNWFETNGRRYGLLKEFRENGLC